MNQLADLLQHSDYPVVMTGAGMSTESGLPDFRSNTGLWKNQNPAALASVEAMENNRSEFLAFYQSRIEALAGVLPNDGHHILADWEQKGFIKSIITQNVDGLHQQAADT